MDPLITKETMIVDKARVWELRNSQLLLMTKMMKRTFLDYVDNTLDGTIDYESQEDFEILEGRDPLERVEKDISSSCHSSSTKL